MKRASTKRLVWLSCQMLRAYITWSGSRRFAPDGMTAGRWAAATARPTEPARVRPTLQRRSCPPGRGWDRESWAAGAAIPAKRRPTPFTAAARKDGESPELRVPPMQQPPRLLPTRVEDGQAPGIGYRIEGETV